VAVTFVLGYHDVVRAETPDEAGFPGAVAARYKLTPELFEEHLAAIEATGVEVVLLGGPPARRAAALTFDDGGASALRVADALERRGWRGHFFVTTSRIGAPGFGAEAELVELQRRGHVIGSHSHSHPTYMGRLSPAEIDAEWRASRSILADVLGSPPATASVPGGYLTRTVVESAARAGYELLLTSEPQARVRVVDGLTVAGRYAVWATTPASVAAGYARGAVVPRARLWVEWRLKSIAKRMSPVLYERARRARAGAA
jgi:peptidoglycan/xylan/chitin deacetylase (PgdA/CDA1 family)